MKTVIDTIRNKRISSKIKQKDFAERLNLSKDYVNKVEKFRKTPSAKVLVNMCNCLGLEINIDETSLKFSSN